MLLASSVSGGTIIVVLLLCALQGDFQERCERLGLPGDDM